MKTRKSFNVKQASAGQIMAEIKRLRTNAERGLAVFFVLLQQVEFQRADVWKAAGVETFDMFLNSHHVCNAARYREFCAGLAKLGDPELAVRMGEQGTAAVRSLRDATPARVAELDERAGKFQAVHGSPPSKQTVAGWVRDLEPHEPKIKHQFSELGRLRAENQQLRAALRERDRRIVQLERTIAKASKKAKAA
jgi:hypothetical protein